VTPSKPLAQSNWSLLLLLAVSAWINYLDRGNLSVAAPVLTRELQLDPAQMGVLLSAFFWTYACFQLVSGWLVDRFSVSHVYALGYFLWSAATLGTGLVSTFAGLVIFRMALGIGESVAYPAYSKLVTAGFPDHERGLANSIIDAATKAGPAVGTLFSGWIIAQYGWRFLFISVGGISLLWIIPWLRQAPRIEGRPAAQRAGPGWRDILTQRAAWATFAGLFCFNYNWYLLLTWLPSYFVMERHFGMKRMSVCSALALGTIAAASMGAGWYSDRLIARGADVGLVRRRFLITGFLIAAMALPGINLPNQAASFALLGIACVGVGITSSNTWALTQAMAGLEAAGKWTGLQNAIGNLGGVLAPVVTGFIVKQLGSFQVAFLASSLVLIAGAVSYAWLLGPIVRIDWTRTRNDASSG
jgi:MFS transporter, ACS family, D-galactonate transporter